MKQVKYWTIFLLISGIIWSAIPVNWLIFIPVVIVWAGVALGVTTVILSIVEGFDD